MNLWPLCYSLGYFKTFQTKILFVNMFIKNTIITNKELTVISAII